MVYSYGAVHLKATLKGHLLCAKFSWCSKKKPRLIPSVEMLISMVGIFPLKWFFFALKLGEKETLQEGQFGGPTWHLLYSVKRTCYGLGNVSMGLVLVWTELLDLKLCCSSPQTWPVNLHPPIHTVRCSHRRIVLSCTAANAFGMLSFNVANL